MADIDGLLDKLEDMGAEVDDTLDRLMGDVDLYAEYLYQFPENENIVKLNAAVKAKDCTTAEHEVHTLKGVALNLGFLPLTDACYDMLDKLRSDKPEDGLELIDEVNEAFNEWKEAIEQYR